MKVFPEIKVIFLKFSTKYSCDLYVFPLNSVKRKILNSRQRDLKKYSFLYVCFQSRVVVRFSTSPPPSYHSASFHMN